MATETLPATPVLPPDWERPSDPDVSHLVTEDDASVDNTFSERQTRLLVESLYATWRRTANRAFVALANVGLFRSPDLPPIVPDVLVSLDVTLLAATTPAVGAGPKSHRSYFVWKYGKAPDVVVEIVSNQEGGEADRKLAEYARVGVRYYAVFDPEHHVQNEDLRTFVLHGNEYVALSEPRFGSTGLGLLLWRGTYQDHPSTWLRWADAHGTMMMTGEEQAAEERARADAAEAENVALRARLRVLEGG